jgi:hypothetical protein
VPRLEASVTRVTGVDAVTIPPFLSRIRRPLQIGFALARASSAMACRPPKTKTAPAGDPRIAVPDAVVRIESALRDRAASGPVTPESPIGICHAEPGKLRPTD